MSSLPDLLRIAATFHDGEGNNDSEVMRQAADELDRLNAQALELCAEISGLRRENELLRVLLHDWCEQWGDGMHPDGDLIDATDAALAGAAVQPSACQHDLQEPGCTVRTIDSWTAQCSACDVMFVIPRPTVPTPAPQPIAAHMSDDECARVRDFLHAREWDGLSLDDVRQWERAFTEARATDQQNPAP